MSLKLYGNPILLDTHESNNIIDVYAAEAKQFRLNKPIIKNPTFEELDRLEVKEVYKDYPGDTLGLNSIGTFQELTIAGSPYETQGTSVAISETGTKIFIINDASSNTDYKGGIAINQSTSGGLFVYQNTYDYYTFTNDAYVDYNDINEDGTMAIFSDQASEGVQYASFFKYNGTSWVTGSPQFVTDVSRSRLSGTYLVRSKTLGKFDVMLYNGTTFVSQQIFQADGAGFITIFDIINQNTIYYYLSGQIKKMTRSGVTWTQTAIYATATVVDMAISGGIMVYATSSNIYVYLNDFLVYSATVSGITKVSTNGVIVIYWSPSSLKVISNTTGTWITQLNTTSVTNVTSLAMNNNRLVVGRSSIGSFGSVQAYEIDNNFNGSTEVILSNIVLDNDEDYDMSINSNYGDVSINAPQGGTYLVSETVGISGASTVDINGTTLIETFTNTNNNSIVSFTNTTDSSSASTGSIKMSGGLGVAKELYVGGRIHSVQGNASIPGYSFIGKTNMGMYSTASDTLAFATAGVNRMNLRADQTNILQPITNVRGTSSAPSYTFTGETTTGMYSDSSNGFLTMTVKSTPLISIADTSITASRTTINLNRTTTNNASSDGNGEAVAIACTYPQTGMCVYQSGNTAHNAITFRTSSGLAGSIQCSGTSTSYLTTSDRKLKKDFKSISVNDKFDQLTIYEYAWKADDKKSIGLIADELNKVFPDCVRMSSVEGEPDMVNYPAMVPYIIQKVKEQDLKIKELENIIKDIIKRLINGSGNSSI